MCSFSQVTVWLCTFLAQEYWHKICSKNVDEIDYWLLVAKRCSKNGPNGHEFIHNKCVSLYQTSAYKQLEEN